MQYETIEKPLEGHLLEQEVRDYINFIRLDVLNQMKRKISGSINLIG